MKLSQANLHLHCSQTTEKKEKRDNCGVQQTAIVRPELNSTNCILKISLIINARSRRVVSQQIYIISTDRKLICPITSRSILILLKILMTSSTVKLIVTTVKLLMDTPFSTDIRLLARRNSVQIWAGTRGLYFIYNFQIDSAIQQASRLMSNGDESPRFKRMRRESGHSPPFGTDINNRWNLHSSRISSCGDS
jgi:hypothetical protein